MFKIKGEIKMKISQIFNEKKFVYSFEVFPPKSNYPIESVYNTIEELSKLKPDYMSVTYGAAGSLADNRTSEIANIIKNKYEIEALAHLTCIDSSREKIDYILEDLKEKGIENILALRGDRPEDKKAVNIFGNSQDLIRYTKKKVDFGLAAACYPEGHIESKDKKIDIDVLKFKEEAGADLFVSQLFLDNNYYYEFLNKAEQKGITSPIQAGIMPIVNKRQVEKIISLCGATLPKKFIRMLDRYSHDKDALRDAGIAYAMEQIVDLISSGVRGVHLYTMNNPYIAKKINDNIESILKSARVDERIENLG